MGPRVCLDATAKTTFFIPVRNKILFFGHPASELSSKCATVYQFICVMFKNLANLYISTEYLIYCSII